LDDELQAIIDQGLNARASKTPRRADDLEADLLVWMAQHQSARRSGASPALPVTGAAQERVDDSAREAHELLAVAPLLEDDPRQRPTLDPPPPSSTNERTLPSATADDMAPTPRRFMAIGAALGVAAAVVVAAATTNVPASGPARLTAAPRLAIDHVVRPAAASAPARAPDPQAEAKPESIARESASSEKVSDRKLENAALLVR
jgi:hypothetical protein